LSTRIRSTAVIIRLNNPLQKFPYDLYEYNPTGNKLTTNKITETINTRTIRDIARFLNLIIPIPIKRESNEKIRANIT
jgi:hypothetical protein